MGLLDYEAVVPLVELLDDSIDSFFSAALDAELTMKAYECLPYVIEDVDVESQLVLILPILFIIFDIFLFVLVFLCRSSSRKQKSKIN
jgi:hypothetical protein